MLEAAHSEQAAMAAAVETSHQGDELLERVSAPVQAGAIALSSGRRFEAETGPHGDLLRVRATSGEVVLSVLVTDRGPVLRFEAADLEIGAAGQVAIDCERFDLRARDAVNVEAGGMLTETVRGDTTRTTSGTAKQEARNLELRAEPGTVTIRANDDVDLKGERIRLNCDPAPMPLSWEDFLARMERDR